MSDLRTLSILVIGSGGREAAIAWKLARSSEQSFRRIDVSPGNGGTESPPRVDVHGYHFAQIGNLPVDISREEHPEWRAKQEGYDLTVVGPEVPLAAGIVDAFQTEGLRIFGPTRSAAQLESSKSFAKEFMRDHAIPTADFAVFDDYEAACSYVAAQDRPLVIKADGLAAGKGVIMCDTPAEAKDALRTILVDRAFGSAGERVVIEERLSGWEVSVLAFVDGEHFAMMPYAADHKRAYDGDQGANTGGMGAFAPRPIDYPDFDNLVIDQVLRPTIEGMAKRGTPYKGVLYMGLMITSNGLQVLEYNCRFGDPETQVILPLLDTDLAEIMMACIHGTLDQLEIRWRNQYCATVVLASGGYPGEYRIGVPITIKSPLPSQIQLFHAGTRRDGDQWVTTGGRVLNVTALGDTLTEAIDRAYAAVDHIHFEGMHYRKDIGRTVRETTQ